MPQTFIQKLHVSEYQLLGWGGGLLTLVSAYTISQEDLVGHCVTQEMLYQMDISLSDLVGL